MTREIKLTRGSYALVDEDDYRWLSLCTWQCTKVGYAVTDSYNKKYYMHRLIMKPTDGMYVDHINGIKNDNRKSNLRICTPSQNGANKIIIKNNHYSKYKGVTWSKAAKKWIAQTQKDKKQIYLGLYETEAGAAIAYNNAALELFGEFALLNVIDENQ